MPLYTRNGDSGFSQTAAGDRLSKEHPLFEAGGALDELGAQAGLLRARLAALHLEGPAAFLRRVQRDIYRIGAYVSSGDQGQLDLLAFAPEVFERLIDSLRTGETKTGFVIPGENELEASFHVLRTVCRRCERRVAALRQVRSDQRVFTYVNRLSDLFFAMACWAEKQDEVPWPSA
jgi:cob(I)alamin adenosyltransferase